MDRRVLTLAGAFAAACAADGDNALRSFSNGVEVIGGTDTGRTTTLFGDCQIDTSDGSIECDQLVVRLNAPGVYEGIGYEVREPVAPTCAGSAVAAPRVAVFSFGSLEIPNGVNVYLRGPHAVALVAASSISIGGGLQMFPGEVGGFIGGGWLDPAAAAAGPAPGEPATGETPQGAGGGGGLTTGGAGGSDGGSGGAALAPQFEPLCGGSGGGEVGHHNPDGSGVLYGQGGRGGSALLLAAGDSITIDGPWGCSVRADGTNGGSTERGGSGGGAGGTISIETPELTMGGDCEISAVGGFGGTTPYALGGAPGDGNVAPDDGADGTYGAGGGGAAGFIRVRTGSCPELRWVEPAAACEEL